jgi:hypothetical protein
MWRRGWCAIQSLGPLWTHHAKAQEAVKEALAKVAEALGCACCLEPLAPGTAAALDCGHTYCNLQTCASSSVTKCSECRQPDRRTRAALWGACQRVQASAPRRLTRFAVLVALPWPSSVLVFGPPIVPAPLASSGTRHFPCRAGRPRRVIMPMSDIPVQTRL